MGPDSSRTKLLTIPILPPPKLVANVFFHLYVVQHSVAVPQNLLPRGEKRGISAEWAGDPGHVQIHTFAAIWRTNGTTFSLTSSIGASSAQLSGLLHFLYFRFLCDSFAGVPLVCFLIKLPLLTLLHESHCLILAEPSARPGTYFMELPSRTAGLVI